MATTATTKCTTAITAKATHISDARPAALRRQHRARSQSPCVALDRDALAAFPKPVVPKRAVSFPEHATLLALRHRVRIQYQDEALRLRSLENVTQLMQSATTTPLHATAPLTNSEILARKALKYRKVLDRMRDVDVHDPTFDASAFLGVEWCKSPTPSPPRRSVVRARGISTAA